MSDTSDYQVSDNQVEDEASVAVTMTEMSNCSGMADGGLSVSVDIESGEAGSSEQGGDGGTASPELSDAMVAANASPHRPSVKPESVLLPPRLAQLALKRGDTRMNMALGGVGRQIERKKQHRFATWMTSLEDRIRADIALAFSEQDPGTGAIDEPQLKLMCANVLTKIDRLLRDAPDFRARRREARTAPPSLDVAALAAPRRPLPGTPSPAGGTAATTAALTATVTTSVSAQSKRDLR